jgi:DNA polymerase-1
MYLIFLDDPHSPDLKLKPAAERLLGLPPEESDVLRDYAIAQKWIPRNAKEYGHLIHRMPGALVGKYANGDTLRTLGIFLLLYKKVLDRGMGEAYDRERRLMPVLLRNERQGVPFDVKRAREDVTKYTAASVLVDGWLRKQLKVPAAFNLDSDAELADALVFSGKADENLFLLTPKGARSVGKDSLIGAVTDKRLLSALQYRSRLGTYVGTFMEPWCLEAEATGGLVHPHWNQVRTAGHGTDTAGARSGRLSASRFMNVPKEAKERTTGKNAYKFPSHIKGLPELPFMRLYLLPFRDETWIKADYKQQELRVLAHFGDGELMRRFNEDPLLDVHDLAADLIRRQYGIPVTRDDTKTLGFGLIYGMGIGTLAERLETDVKTANTIKAAYRGIFPELKGLEDDLRLYSAEGKPLTTWGGRQYFCEPPKFVASRGRVCTFEYKMLNYLIQPSSADCTKEAVIRYDEAKQRGRFLLTVHDEINLSVPKKFVKSEAKILTDVMASVEFDVPMLADVGVGPNWGELKELKV